MGPCKSLSVFNFIHTPITMYISYIKVRIRIVGINKVHITKGVTMKVFVRLASLICLFSLLVSSLVSCGVLSDKGKNKEKFSKTFIEYFDTVTTVTGYAANQDEFSEVASLIEERFSEYHKLFDAYHSSSDSGYESLYAEITNVKDINSLENGAHLERKVDKKLIDFLLYCKEIYTITNGETNIAMGSVLRLWHNERENAEKNPAAAKLPDNAALMQAAEHTDINNLIIDKEKSTVFISDAEMFIDVGAIAKGYATEMVAQELEAKGISGYAISAGGNVRTVGSKADGDAWSVGIENPEDAFGGYVETVKVMNQSVVTSGSYQRYYTVGGTRYHHIIDRDTLFPSKYFLSVSIVTKSSALADALSTALFSMSLEDGMALIESIGGVEAVWISTDGTKTVSSGFSSLRA